MGQERVAWATRVEADKVRRIVRPQATNWPSGQFAQRDGKAWKALIDTLSGGMV